MSDIRKYLNIMEDMSKDIIKEELNSDDLMRIDNYIKNELVPKIKKNDEINYKQTQLLSDIQEIIKHHTESIQKMNKAILFLLNKSR